MKRLFISILLALTGVITYAQKDESPLQPADSGNKEAFRAYLYNDEFEVFLRINFYQQDITVPGQELYGQVPGYLGKKRNSFCWIITSATIKDENTSQIALINDYRPADPAERFGIHTSPAGGEHTESTPQRQVAETAQDADIETEISRYYLLHQKHFTA